MESCPVSWKAVAACSTLYLTDHGLMKQPKEVCTPLPRLKSGLIDQTWKTEAEQWLLLVFL
jgi:hypothetical protein